MLDPKILVKHAHRVRSVVTAGIRYQPSETAKHADVSDKCIGSTRRILGLGWVQVHMLCEVIDDNVYVGVAMLVGRRHRETVNTDGCTRSWDSSRSTLTTTEALSQATALSTALSEACIQNSSTPWA